MEHLDKKGCYKVEIILLAPLFSMLNPGGKFDKKGCYKVEIGSAFSIFNPGGKWMEGGLESSSSRVESGGVFSQFGAFLTF